MFTVCAVDCPSHLRAVAKDAARSVKVAFREGLPKDEQALVVVGPLAQDPVRVVQSVQVTSHAPVLLVVEQGRLAQVRRKVRTAPRVGKDLQVVSLEDALEHRVHDAVRRAHKAARSNRHLRRANRLLRRARHLI